MNELKAGIYQHYKGPLYLVLGLAHDANADILSICPTDTREAFYQTTLGEREVVVYIGLQLDEAHAGARLAVRTLDDFFAWVHGAESSQAFGSRCEDWAVVSDTGPWCHCAKQGSERGIVRRFTYFGLRYHPLDAKIDELHGPGAAAAIDEAYGES